LPYLLAKPQKLGIPERKVGATYESFLSVLKEKNAEIYAQFIDPRVVTFIKRIAALRHYTSHRGSISPGKVLKTAEEELSDAQVDAMITAAGLDKYLLSLPAGKVREDFRQSLRFKFRMEENEREGTLMDDMVLIEVDGKSFFMSPAMDIEWNFEKFLGFMNRVLTETLKCL
jgi:hypothetical protein